MALSSGDQTAFPLVSGMIIGTIKINKTPVFSYVSNLDQLFFVSLKWIF